MSEQEICPIEDLYVQGMHRAQDALVSIAENLHLDESAIEQVLDVAYTKALEGIPQVSKSTHELADEYLERYQTPQAAARALVKYQIAKCATSGFLSNLGGLITMPVIIPANIASVLYVQMRMIAAIAVLGGYDVQNDEVQTMVYTCLAGNQLSELMKGVGITIGEKVFTNTVKKIPGKALVALNQRMGFRFVTKFGEKSLINLGKLVPFVGGIIGGSMDALSTYAVASMAMKTFLTDCSDEELSFSESEVQEMELLAAHEEEISPSLSTGDE